LINTSTRNFIIVKLQFVCDCVIVTSYINVKLWLFNCEDYCNASLDYSIRPVIDSLDHPLFAARKEGFFNFSVLFHSPLYIAKGRQVQPDLL
jgi:hypothetical protein